MMLSQSALACLLGPAGFHSSALILPNKKEARLIVPHTVFESRLEQKMGSRLSEYNFYFVLFPTENVKDESTEAPQVQF